MTDQNEALCSACGAVSEPDDDVCPACGSAIRPAAFTAANLRYADSAECAQAMLACPSHLTTQLAVELRAAHARLIRAYPVQDPYQIGYRDALARALTVLGADVSAITADMLTADKVHLSEVRNGDAAAQTDSGPSGETATDRVEDPPPRAELELRCTEFEAPAPGWPPGRTETLVSHAFAGGAPGTRCQCGASEIGTAGQLHPLNPGEYFRFIDDPVSDAPADPQMQQRIQDWYEKTFRVVPPDMTPPWQKDLMYRIFTGAHHRITCPKCGRTSYHPEDIKQGWCGNCHAYTHGTVRE